MYEISKKLSPMTEIKTVSQCVKDRFKKKTMRVEDKPQAK